MSEESSGYFIKKIGERDRVFEAITKELARANVLFGPFHSTHEAYGVIKEEFEEFWDEVKAAKHPRVTKKMEKELVQLAAMAIKTILTLEKEPQNA